MDPPGSKGVYLGTSSGGSCCGRPDEGGPRQSSGKSRELFLVLKPELEALGLGMAFPSSLAIGGPPLATGLRLHGHPPWAGWAQSSGFGPVCRPGRHPCVPRGSLWPCTQSGPLPGPAASVSLPDPAWPLAWAQPWPHRAGDP